MGMNSAIVTGGNGALGRVVASTLMNNGIRVAIPVRPGSRGGDLPPEPRNPGLRPSPGRLLNAGGEWGYSSIAPADMPGEKRSVRCPQPHSRR
jgi:nucleoside-diphosphate-sugar epimerase